MITVIFLCRVGKIWEVIDKLNKDQLAITQEKGTEYINSPTFGMLTPLTQGTDVFNTQASENIWNMSNNPTQFIKDNLGLSSPNPSNVQNVGGNNFTQNLEQVVFSLPNVKNYDELLLAMQKDKNFERLILSMTIDRIAGGSSLAKKNAIRK